ncbi:MAG: phospho-N-acetylmuramoyl-pentapeptide-transferase [Clostridia bacterium]|nr:phospho-N-acetylmuramoyl-pentapeptide-transferase [Clostridia bacterium]
MSTQMLNLLLGFLVTFVLGVIAIPRLKKLKVGQIVRDDGPKEHLKKTGTPTMGGITIVLSLVILLGINAFKMPILVLPIIAVLGFGFVGFMDDYKKLVLKSPKGLSPMKKILGIFLVTAIFIILYINVFDLGTDIIIPILNQPYTLSLGAFVLFTSFILLATSNAVNLTDGLDGLASGVVAIIMTFFTLVAIKNQNAEMVVFGALTAGTCLAFLLFNSHPAKVFMGDTGSLALGGAIAAIAIILKMPLYLAIVAIVCILDTISVILQVGYFKLTKGKRLFKMAPFHHHMELCGIKETKVVLVFWLVTLIACAIAYVI